MKTQDTLFYTSEHLWVQPTDEGHYLSGITDYAQDLLGDIVYVEAPAVGSSITAGQPCGLVESVKTGSDLHAPLNGTILAINEALQGNPELINEAPYKTWIFKWQIANQDDIGKLLSAKQYEELLG